MGICDDGGGIVALSETGAERGATPAKTQTMS